MSVKFNFSDELKNTNGELLIILATLPIYFFFPLITLLIWIFYHCYFKEYKILTILLIALTFGLVASTTKSISVEMTDIERYKTAYLKLVDVSSFNDLLYQTVIVSGEINILFIAINFLFTRLFPTYFPIMPFFWVTVTYVFCLLTYYQYAKVIALSKGEYAFYFVVVALLGIPFYQTTETIKQCSAIAIMGYALVLNSQDKKSGLIWLIVSLLVHLSGLFLLPVYFLMRKKWVINYFIPMFLIALAISFVNVNDVFTTLLGDYLGVGFKERAELYADYNWNLSRRFYLILVLYGIMVLFLLFSQSKNVIKNIDLKVFNRLLNMNVLAFLFLLINRSNVHNFVRYTLTYFPFYILITLQILNVDLVKKQKIVLWLFFVAFFAYSNLLLLQLRTTADIGYANSYMNNSVVDLITSNWVDYLTFK